MKYYTCGYCFTEFVPKRRRIQKYCSVTCRVKAHHARKTKDNIKKVENKNQVPDLPPIPAKTKVETMSVAGVGNAALGTLAADGVKSIGTKQENKAATKGDIAILTNKIIQRYHKIKNLPPKINGSIPYFDMETKMIVYSGENNSNNEIDSLIA